MAFYTYRKYHGSLAVLHIHQLTACILMQCFDICMDSQKHLLRYLLPFGR